MNIKHLYKIAAMIGKDCHEIKANQIKHANNSFFLNVFQDELVHFPSKFHLPLNSIYGLLEMTDQLYVLTNKSQIICFEKEMKYQETIQLSKRWLAFYRIVVKIDGWRMINGW